MITHFHKIGLTIRKRFVCACGRRLTRLKRFYQTQNPWNTDAGGKPKSQVQIFNEVRLEAATWQLEADPCTHLVRILRPKKKD